MCVHMIAEFFLDHKGHVYINFTNISEHSSFYEHPRCRQVSVCGTISVFFVPLSPAFVLPCLLALLKGCCCKSVTEPPPAVHAKWWGEAVRPVSACSLISFPSLLWPLGQLSAFQCCQPHVCFTAWYIPCVSPGSKPLACTSFKSTARTFISRILVPVVPGLA